MHVETQNFILQRFPDINLLRSECKRFRVTLFLQGFLNFPHQHDIYLSANSAPFVDLSALGEKKIIKKKMWGVKKKNLLKYLEFIHIRIFHFVEDMKAVLVFDSVY